MKPALFILATLGLTIPLLLAAEEADSGKEIFVAVGYGGRRMISEDAETWHDGGKIEGRKATHWRKGVYGNGRFVVTGNNGGISPPWIVTSKDGTTIDSFVDGIPSIRGIAFGNGRFVIVGMNGVRRSSADGVEWENHDVPDAGITWKESPDLKIRGVKWTDGKRFIMTGWPGKMSYSYDGGRTVEKANEMTANGINVVVRGFVEE